MDHLITVSAAVSGWSVRSSMTDNDMLFLSAEKAETAARALARAVSDAGQDAAVEIWLRDGRLAGRFLCPAGPARAPGALPSASSPRRPA